MFTLPFGSMVYSKRPLKIMAADLTHLSPLLPTCGHFNDKPDSVKHLLRKTVRKEKLKKRFVILRLFWRGDYGIL